MLRGLPHLCQYMPRSKDARRLIPDPENEPNFEVISKAFPVPGCFIEDRKEEPSAKPPPVESARAMPQVASLSTQLPPPKVPRVMLGPSASLPIRSLEPVAAPLVPAVDVGQARRALVQQQLSLQVQRELLENRARREQQQSAAATLAAYADLLRGVSGANATPRGYM